MKAWFESLEERERLFVGIGAVVVALTILYAGIWMPFSRSHVGLQSTVSDWQEALTDLKPLRVQFAAGGAGESASGSAQLTPIIIVDRTLRSRGLERYRTSSNPTSSNGIRVEFENVAFDDLVLWLGDLSSQYAMHVQAGTFAGGTRVETGRVNASLTLERLR